MWKVGAKKVPTNTNILWQSVLGEIEVSVSPANFTTWFKNTALLAQDDGKIVVGVPSIFAKRQFEEKFNELIQKTLRHNGVKTESVEYRIQPVIGSDIVPPQPQPLTQSPPAATTARPPQTQNIGFRPAPGSNLNPRYNFDAFVAGSGNELAYSAAQAVAREPGSKYNPLFIYGGSGVGKTHLIQSIGNAIARKNPNTKVEYVTCERFFKDLVSATLSKKPFSNHYRSADVLIVDDMQFIAGKEKTQEEFFHTFNTLYEANKQIIISSDKLPSAIPTLNDRLRSRFDSGMTVDMQMPDYETRVAILQAKIRQARRTVPVEVIEYLATHIESSIRELEGALVKLFAHCEMRDLVPTLELVEQMVNPPSIKSKRINPQLIVERTARYFGLTTEEVCSPKRDKHISEPRQIAMYLMRVELKLSFPQIAKQVGRNDHTTAMHSINKIEKALLNNHYMRRSVYEIKEKLYV